MFYLLILALFLVAFGVFAYVSGWLDEKTDTNALNTFEADVEDFESLVGFKAPKAAYVPSVAPVAPVAPVANTTTKVGS